MLGSYQSSKYQIATDGFGMSNTAELLSELQQEFLTQGNTLQQKNNIDKNKKEDKKLFYSKFKSDFTNENKKEIAQFVESFDTNQVELKPLEVGLRFESIQPKKKKKAPTAKKKTKKVI